MLSSACGCMMLVLSAGRTVEAIPRQVLAPPRMAPQGPVGANWSAVHPNLTAAILLKIPMHHIAPCLGSLSFRPNASWFWQQNLGKEWSMKVQDRPRSGGTSMWHPEIRTWPRAFGLVWGEERWTWEGGSNALHDCIDDIRAKLRRTWCPDLPRSWPSWMVSK